MRDFLIEKGTAVWADKNVEELLTSLYAGEFGPVQRLCRGGTNELQGGQEVQELKEWDWKDGREHGFRQGKIRSL